MFSIIVIFSLKLIVILHPQLYKKILFVHISFCLAVLAYTQAFLRHFLSLHCLLFFPMYSIAPIALYTIIIQYYTLFFQCTLLRLLYCNQATPIFVFIFFLLTTGCGAGGPASFRLTCCGMWMAGVAGGVDKWRGGSLK